MMRSMFAGISGLKAHQMKMDVIGNNIANVNTIGYRAGRITFQEVFNQTLKGASAPDSALGRGGTNPMQIGLGTGIGSIDTIITGGSQQRTDSPLDLSIDGDGFFIVKGSKADTFMFTRAGNFTRDLLGNLVTSGGMSVYGWMDYGEKMNDDGTFSFNVNKPVEPINLYTDDYNGNKQVIAAKATENISFAGNLDTRYPTVAAGDDAQIIVPMIVYDSLGNEYEIAMAYRKIEAAGGITTWEWSIKGGDLTTTASGEISFDSDGKIILDAPDATNPRVTPVINLIPADSIGSKAFDVKLDLRKLTMFADESSVKPLNSDGYPPGKLSSFSIGNDGIIMGIYSNGKPKPLGMIALAEFENPAGLQKTGNNMYIQTSNSGVFRSGIKPGTGSTGTLNPGTLEMSNVDLASQFTDMIITQRGFQANSRIMTTVDEMLQEMVNMKR
ncbi:MAG TPA: flagellar hook protein FlgE [Clostridiales bacterium]|nr:flagellar hook protein FlgE [Clostridiales bacterium]